MVRRLEVASSVLLALVVGAAAAMSGCARAQVPVAPAAVVAASAAAAEAALLRRLEALPVGAGVKPVRPTTVLAPGATRPETPVAMEKIRSLAKAALDEAEAKPTWQTKWEATHAALGQIDAVPLVDRKLANLAAKLGLRSALGVGYLGSKPLPEDRYKIQVEVLTYAAGSETEVALAVGSPIADLCVRMMEVTTGFDGGFRVGLSMLFTLRDHYKEPKVKAAVEALLNQVKGCESKEEGYHLILKGLRDLALTLKK